MASVSALVTPTIWKPTAIAFRDSPPRGCGDGPIPSSGKRNSKENAPSITALAAARPSGCTPD
jgi:hypothetical protein